MSRIESETVKWKATRQTSRIGDANNGSAECHVSKGIPPPTSQHQEALEVSSESPVPFYVRSLLLPMRDWNQ